MPSCSRLVPLLLLLSAASAAQPPGPQEPNLLHFDWPDLPALSAEGLRVEKDLDYYTGPDAEPVKHKLDLYAPPDAQRAPVLLFIHGGGWRMGDRQVRAGLYGNVGIACARAGIVGVLISYRLSPGVQHPEHVRDVARALAWVQAHIADYGGDPQRVFVSGHSAGGHLAALVTLDTRYLKEVGLPPDFLKGAIPMSGVYNVSRLAVLRSIRERLVLPAFGEDPQGWRDASPLHHVRADAPPFLLLNAEQDWGLQAQTREFAAKLEAAGVPVETAVTPGTTHVTVIARVGQEGDVTTERLIRFIRRVTEEVGKEEQTKS